jgi:hypothetical protein
VRNWDAGEVFRAWTLINRTLREAMQSLPSPILLFLSHRSSDAVVSQAALDVLARRDNPDLPGLWLVAAEGAPSTGSLLSLTWTR